MREFSRRTANSGVTINAVHPGVIRTNLGSTSGVMGIFLGLIKMFWGDPREGAKPPVWLGNAPELAGVTGKYYNLFKEVELTKSAGNLETASKLWEISKELSGLSTTV